MAPLLISSDAGIKSGLNISSERVLDDILNNVRDIAINTQRTAEGLTTFQKDMLNQFSLAFGSAFEKAFEKINRGVDSTEAYQKRADEFQERTEEAAKETGEFQKRTEEFSRYSHTAFKTLFEKYTGDDKKRAEEFIEELRGVRKEQQALGKIIEEGNRGLDALLKSDSPAADKLRKNIVKEEYKLNSKNALKDFGVEFASRDPTLNFLMGRLGGVSKESHKQKREAEYNRNKFKAAGYGEEYDTLTKAKEEKDKEFMGLWAKGVGLFKKGPSADSNANPIASLVESITKGAGPGGFWGRDRKEDIVDAEFSVVSSPENNNQSGMGMGMLALPGKSDAPPEYYTGIDAEENDIASETSIPAILQASGIGTIHQLKRIAEIFEDSSETLKGASGQKSQPSSPGISDLPGIPSIPGGKLISKLGKGAITIGALLAVGGLQADAEADLAASGRVETEKKQEAFLSTFLPRISGKLFDKKTMEQIYGDLVAGIGTDYELDYKKEGSNYRVTGVRPVDWGAAAKGVSPADLPYLRSDYHQKFHKGGIVGLPSGKVSAPTDEVNTTLQRGEVVLPTDVAPLYKDMAVNTGKTAALLEGKISSLLETIKELLADGGKTVDEPIPGPTFLSKGIVDR